MYILNSDITEVTSPYPDCVKDKLSLALTPSHPDITLTQEAGPPARLRIEIDVTVLIPTATYELTA